MSIWNFNLESCGVVSGYHSATDTTITLEEDQGARFEGSPRKLVIFDAMEYDDPGDAIANGYGEIVYQDDRTDDVLTVQRGRDGTTALELLTGKNRKWYICNFVDTSIGGDFVNVKSLGAVADGITDDTTAVHDAINTAAAGSTIFFPAGNYLLDSWPTSGQNYDKNLTLCGEGAISVIEGGPTSLFMGVGEELSVRDLGFTGWDRVFTFDPVDTTLELISFERCHFVSLDEALTWKAPATGGKARAFSIRDCVFQVTTGTPVTLYGPWDSMVVDGCVFDNLDAPVGLQLGRIAPADQEDWVNTKVTNSRFSDLTTTSSASRSLFILSQFATIENNYINGVSGGTVNCEGMFVQLLRGTICRNKILGVDGEDAGAGYGIRVTGNDLANSVSSSNDGYEVIVADNIIAMGDTDGSQGITIENDRILCARNIITGVQNAGISSSTTASRDHDGLMICDNFINFGTADASSGHGIVIWHGGDDSHVVNNTIIGSTKGIQFSTSSGTVDNRSVIGNSVDASGIGLHVSMGVLLTGLRVLGNHFRNASSFGIRIDGAQQADLVQIAWNQFTSITQALQVSLGTTPTNLLLEQQNAGIKEVRNRVELITAAAEGLKVTAGTTIFEITQSKGVEVTAGGLNVVAGGATVTAGNFAVSAGTSTLGGALSVTTGGASVSGGLTVSSGTFTLAGGNVVHNQAGVPTGGTDGDIYMRTDGGTGTTFYVKRSGSWVALA